MQSRGGARFESLGRRMQGYDIETLIKAKKQCELAAELLDVAIEEHKQSDGDRDKHIIQACECADEGTSLL